MNFADFMRSREDLNPDKSVREMVEDATKNWKKEFSIIDISNVIRDTVHSLAEELEDPSVVLLGMMINLEIAHKLFPKEELHKYLASQEAKGDE